jgi:hypothetical protein
MNNDIEMSMQAFAADRTISYALRYALKADESEITVKHYCTLFRQRCQEIVYIFMMHTQNKRYDATDEYNE